MHSSVGPTVTIRIDRLRSDPPNALSPSSRPRLGHQRKLKDAALTSPCTGDYCDVYLTHDSMSVRKAHNSGRNHLRNVVEYYQRMRQDIDIFLMDSH